MKWLLTILLLSSLYGQGFGYNYVDPCNQQAVNLNYTTETLLDFGLLIIIKEDFYLDTSKKTEYKVGRKCIVILKDCFLVNKLLKEEKQHQQYN